MKVLTVISGDTEGSSMIFAKRQVLSLKKQGIESVIFFLSSRTSLKALYNESKRFRSQIKNFNPDIVHCHYGTMTSFFCSVNTKRKIIITFHGSDLNKTPQEGFLRDIFGRFLSQLSVLKAKRVICVSQALVQRIWWRKKIANVVPMGINTEMFKPIDKISAREKLGLKNEKKIVLFNANNPLIKRLDIAKKTIEILQKADSNYFLYILEGNVEPNLIPWYINASDCLLVCSDYEGGPMMVKEAIACNLPIVGVDVGDIKERLSGVNNCIITNQNALDLSTAIDKVIKNDKRANGRDILIKDKLTEEEIASKIIEIYYKIINKK